MQQRTWVAESIAIGASASEQREARARAVVRALTHIEARFHEPLTLGGIAAAAHVSRFHFARLFRQEIRMSPMQYVRWRRILEAKRLLRAGQVPLTLIAKGVGFFDQSHFSRAFRSATGLTPHQYASRGVIEHDAGEPDASLPALLLPPWSTHVPIP